MRAYAASYPGLGQVSNILEMAGICDKDLKKVKAYAFTAAAIAESARVRPPRFYSPNDMQIEKGISAFHPVVLRKAKEKNGLELTIASLGTKVIRIRIHGVHRVSEGKLKADIKGMEMNLLTSLLEGEITHDSKSLLICNMVKETVDKVEKVRTIYHGSLENDHYSAFFCVWLIEDRASYVLNICDKKLGTFTRSAPRMGFLTLR